MSAATVGAAIVQVGGALVLAPLIPGAIASLEARLQGRRGPSPLQPYRELRRLWGRSGVAPEPHGAAYVLAPPVVAGSTLVAALLLPIAGVTPVWGLGNDALALVGLLIVGRAALGLAAWDTGSGFALIGAARDLTFAVFVEGLLALVVVLVAVGAGTTDLVAIAQAAQRAPFAQPEQWLAAVAFALVVVAEAGRRPFDNPDTHLELTMIHEGPLLEYGGRDQALLQWASAARQWIVLVLGAALFVPLGGAWAARVAFLAVTLVALCGALAWFETTQAKMRVLRVPRWAGAGAVVCLIGLAFHAIGGAP